MALTVKMDALFYFSHFTDVVVMNSAAFLPQPGSTSSVDAGLLKGPKVSFYKLLIIGC